MSSSSSSISLHSSMSSTTPCESSLSDDPVIISLPLSELAENLNQNDAVNQDTEAHQPFLEPTLSAQTLMTVTPQQRRQRTLLLVGLSSLLILSTLLAFLWVPLHEHTPQMSHPLTALRLAEPQDQTSIRYLTFGSASSLGEGLDDATKAYPYLLSPTVHNAASRVGTGASLSAICTQSIVGDEAIYDVIVIDFVDSDADSVVRLALRLRQRFPSAQLVFVRLWSPATHILYEGSITALEWWKQQQQNQKQLDTTPTKTPFKSFEFEAAVLQTEAHQWTFVDQSDDALLIDTAIAEVQGRLYNLPVPELESESAFAVLNNSKRSLNLFQDQNPTLLSELGHRRVSEGIQHLVLGTKNEYEPSLLQRPDRNVVGSWGSGDACSMWYASGDTSSLRSRRRASLVDFSRESSGTHKHAVEISRRGGSIDVENPFSEPRMLYLTYMTAASDKQQQQPREYPRTKIGLGGRPTVMIDPIFHLGEDETRTPTANTDDDEEEHHHARTTAVGMVPPGKTVLTLKSLDPKSKSRFRLVGLHFLNKGKVSIPFEFALEPEPSHG